jgi:hypothetical protein
LWIAVLLTLAGLLLPTPGLARDAVSTAAPAPGDYSVELITYGPGNIYWQRFGHNAIHLREPAIGLDHNFNYGFFDFEQENFLLRFVQGRMLYFAAASEAQAEIDQYRSDGRSVRVQTLDLPADRYVLLRDFLLSQVRPENRDYLYDYYLDNCSTRVRDALDLALGGALAEQFTPQPGELTFRDHTRRSTVEDFWYYLGLELALGMPIDRPLNRWDEMFLPAVLADNLVEVDRLASTGLTPLVTDDSLLYRGQVGAVPVQPPQAWPRYLALSLAVLLVVWAFARHAPPLLVEALTKSWLLIGGTLGILIMAAWFWTDHQAAGPNLNLLLFSPTLLLALVPRLSRPFGWLMLLVSVAAATLSLLPGIQYMADVTALVVPLNLAVALRLVRNPAAADPGPG